MKRKSALAFAYMKKIRKLDCNLVGYNDDIMSHLAFEKTENVLKILEPVQYLHQEGTLCLNYSILKGNDSVKIFIENTMHNIDKLHLKNMTFYSDGFYTLTVFLQSKKNLTEFSVDGSRLSDFHLHQLLISLQDNVFLKKLSIQRNEIGDLSAQYLREYLQKTTILEELNLSKIMSTFNFIKIIAEGLRVNNSLKIIHLRNNNLKSFIFWLDAFWYHPTLKKVNNDYICNISTQIDINKNDFLETLKQKRHTNDEIWKKVTAISLKYIKTHKKIDINFGYKDEIFPYLDIYMPVLQEYWNTDFSTPTA
jgi:hypothetical protein